MTKEEIIKELKEFVSAMKHLDSIGDSQNYELLYSSFADVILSWIKTREKELHLEFINKLELHRDFISAGITNTNKRISIGLNPGEHYDEHGRINSTLTSNKG